MMTEFLVSCVAMIGSIVTTIPNNAKLTTKKACKASCVKKCK